MPECRLEDYLDQATQLLHSLGADLERQLARKEKRARGALSPAPKLQRTGVAGGSAPTTASTAEQRRLCHFWDGYQCDRMSHGRDCSFDHPQGEPTPGWNVYNPSLEKQPGQPSCMAPAPSARPSVASTPQPHG
jgi:hypothetical protein